MWICYIFDLLSEKAFNMQGRPCNWNSLFQSWVRTNWLSFWISKLYFPATHVDSIKEERYILSCAEYVFSDKRMELFWLATWLDVSCFFWGSLYLANLACAIKSLPLCTQPCLCCPYLVNLTGNSMYHENAQIVPSFMPNYSFVPSMVVNLCVSFKYA